MEDMGNKGGEVCESKEQLRRAERPLAVGMEKAPVGERNPNRMGILNGRVEGGMPDKQKNCYMSFSFTSDLKD